MERDSQSLVLEAQGPGFYFGGVRQLRNLPSYRDTSSRVSLQLKGGFYAFHTYFSQWVPVFIHSFIWFLIFTFTLSTMPHFEFLFPFRLHLFSEAQAAEPSEEAPVEVPVEEIPPSTESSTEESSLPLLSSSPPSVTQIESTEQIESTLLFEAQESQK